MKTAKGENTCSKVAIVDVPAVVMSSKQVNALKEEQAKKAQEIAQWIEAVRADVAKRGTQEEQAALAKQYDAELAKRREANTVEYSKKLADIDASITATIVKEAKERGYSVVLTKTSVLYGGEDITEEIKKVVD